MTGRELLLLHMAGRLRYQRRAGSPWSQYYQHLIDCGESFDARTRPAAQPTAVKLWVRRHRPQPGHCFQDALRCAAFAKLTYYEGWAFTGVLAVEHAWLIHRPAATRLVAGRPTTSEGPPHVIDVTFDAIDRSRPARDKVPANLPYLGCPVPTADAFALQNERAELGLPAFGPILGAYLFGLFDPEAPSPSAEQAEQLLGRLQILQALRGQEKTGRPGGGNSGGDGSGGGGRDNGVSSCAT